MPDEQRNGALNPSALGGNPPGASQPQALANPTIDNPTGPSGRSRTGTIVVACCIALLVALTMLGGVLNVGDHLAYAHPALGWIFYALLVALVIVGIVVPLFKVARRPIFSLYQLHDEQGHAKRRRCQMLVDNLVANTDISDEDVAYLQNCLAAGDKADDLLIEYFNQHCVPLIDADTKRAATTAFFVSAIAHSPLINMVTMLSISAYIASV